MKEEIKCVSKVIHEYIRHLSSENPQGDNERAVNLNQKETGSTRKN